MQSIPPLSQCTIVRKKAAAKAQRPPNVPQDGKLLNTDQSDRKAGNMPKQNSLLQSKVFFFLNTYMVWILDLAIKPPIKISASHIGVAGIRPRFWLLTPVSH